MNKKKISKERRLIPHLNGPLYMNLCMWTFAIDLYLLNLCVLTPRLTWTVWLEWYDWMRTVDMDLMIRLCELYDWPELYVWIWTWLVEIDRDIGFDLYVWQEVWNIMIGLDWDDLWTCMMDLELYRTIDRSVGLGHTGHIGQK